MDFWVLVYVNWMTEWTILTLKIDVMTIGGIRWRASGGQVSWKTMTKWHARVCVCFVLHMVAFYLNKRMKMEYKWTVLVHPHFYLYVFYVSFFPMPCALGGWLPDCITKYLCYLAIIWVFSPTIKSHLYKLTFHWTLLKSLVCYFLPWPWLLRQTP